MPRYISTSLIGLALVAVGCGSDPPTACIESAPYAIEVAVFDAATGHPAACGALGIAIDGSFSDSLHVWCYGPADSLYGAYMTSEFGRLGRYTILIQKPGYHDWTRSDILVRDGACGLIGVRLRADLLPLEGPDVDIVP